MVAYELPAATPGDAPIASSNERAYKPPNRPTGTATMRPSRIACTAALAAPSASFSPIRRATTAMAPTLKPIATAYRRTSIDSVNATVATASAPSLATKNTSTTAKTDSRQSSSTIGIASKTIASRMDPVV
jgi:hypothetical protein